MKIKISRSFSQKKRIAQYEPIESFCAAEVEFEIPQGVAGEFADGETQRMASQGLDIFCREEVAKTIKSAVLELKPLCAACGGRSDKPLTNEGLCADCSRTEGAKSAEWRAEQRDKRSQTKIKK